MRSRSARSRLPLPFGLVYDRGTAMNRVRLATCWAAAAGLGLLSGCSSCGGSSGGLFDRCSLFRPRPQTTSYEVAGPGYGGDCCVLGTGSVGPHLIDPGTPFTPPSGMMAPGTMAPGMMVPGTMAPGMMVPGTMAPGGTIPYPPQTLPPPIAPGTMPPANGNGALAPATPAPPSNGTMSRAR